ncbi:MAG: ARC6/PARC6 family protein [Chamaesiphon sp.]|nr:ARC6/PARC6 family protein [Chamaesiphon sp.]
MVEEYPLVNSLENKIDELHRDRSTARKIVDSNSNLLTINTALEDYIAIKKDLTIPLGIRYLALSCVAAHYQLYQDSREVSQIKDLTGQAINIPTHAEVFNAIQVVKNQYCQIYDCDPREFDRVERLTKEMLPNSITKIEDFHAIHNDNYLSEDEIRAEERDKIFKLLSLIIFTFLIGGSSGILVSMMMRQQPHPSPVNGQIHSPSNVSRISDPFAFTSGSQISQDEAISLIQKWLEARKKLFSPPFDRNIATQLTTGKAYKKHVEITNGKIGSTVEWLMKHRSSYIYTLQRIDEIVKFEANDKDCIIDVRLTEYANRYDSKGKLVRAKSGEDRKIVRYFITEEGENLKISEYINITPRMKREM